MSLDVTLTLPGDPIPRDVSRIFVRRGGETVEITRAEWDEAPDSSRAIIVVGEADGRDVFEANITHNLREMADACGLYAPLWRPDEVGATCARDLIEPIRQGLDALRVDRERFEAFNPTNGWGDYDLLVRFAANYLAACERWPDATVTADR